MIKDSLIETGNSFKFVFRNPSILVFVLIRISLFLVVYLALSYYFPDLYRQAFMNEPFYKLFGLFKDMCLPGIPCGMLFLYLFFIISLILNIGTISYAQAVLQQQKACALYSLNIIWHSWRQILGWSLVYTPVYFGILTKQFLLLPFIFLLTFFITPVIAQGGQNFGDNLIKSINYMKNKLGAAILFVLIFTAILLLAVFLFIYLAATKLVLAEIILALMLAGLVTLKDIFKIIVVSKKS